MFNGTSLATRIAGYLRNSGYEVSYFDGFLGYVEVLDSFDFRFGVEGKSLSVVIYYPPEKKGVHDSDVKSLLDKFSFSYLEKKEISKSNNEGYLVKLIFDDAYVSKKGNDEEIFKAIYDGVVVPVLSLKKSSDSE